MQDRKTFTGMNDQQHWDVLGLQPGASLEDIKSAYRRAARDNHPDRNPNDAAAVERFRKASEAYRTLTQRPTRAVPSDSKTSSSADVFGDIFGRKSAPQRGADTRFSLKLSVLDAAKGGQRAIKVPGQVVCGACRGSRAAPGTAPTPCSACGGRGFRSVNKGFFPVNEPCELCDGHGFTVSDPCPQCDGQGSIRVEHELVINLPQGVKDGTRLRVPGRGMLGKNGSPPGDLYVVVAIETSPFLEQKGKDIWVEVPVPFGLAVLGGNIQIPTIEGIEHIVVPAGTPSGHTFCLSGRGINGGDQWIRIKVDVPESLSEDLEKALRLYSSMEETTQVLSSSKRYSEMVKGLQVKD